MKKILTTLAVLMISAAATTASAGGLLIRSNVPAADGSSVAGFSIIGPGLTYFVAESAASKVNNGATVVPAGVDVYVLEDVLAYLASIGITDVTPVFPMRDVCPNENETVDTCTVPLERVFAYGGDHW